MSTTSSFHTTETLRSDTPPAYSRNPPTASTTLLPTNTNTHIHPTSAPEIQSEKKRFHTTTATFLSQLTWPNKSAQSPKWQPNALRPSILILSILISLSLIAVLQYLLLRSQHNQGIQFAAKISALPVRQTFLWQYFPIIIAVLFSIFWAWIDLETKRLEPYYQLSKKEGALGKDSLLLRYPFDFVPLVPITALKARHWSVFFASIAVVLITWGIVPIQAAIFSTNRVTRTFPTSFAVSTGFMPASEQETKLTMRYAQSTYGIVMLNQTLPPYTTRNYTLAPFTPVDVQVQLNGNWTAPTTLYSLNLQCEEAITSQSIWGPFTIYNSTTGCSYGEGLQSLGNDTIGMPSGGSPAYNVSQGYLTVKEFSARYFGYSNENGFADYYLEGYCPKTANHTFLAGFSPNKKKYSDPPENSTNIYCQPVYYSQAVNATVDAATKMPLEIALLGPKQQLPSEMFNTTVLESQLNGGVARVETRGNSIPGTSMPKYLDQLFGTELSMYGSSTVQPMAALAALIGGPPLAQYIDPKVLGGSYEKAYRLLFVNSMVDVLNGGVNASKEAIGQRQMSTEAVVLEAVFTYIVEGLLVVVSMATMALLYFSVTRKRNLQSDPSTIASVMSLVADNQSLLSDLQDMDCCTVDEVDKILSHRRWKLVHDDVHTGIVEIDQAPDSGLPVRLGQPRNTAKEVAKPIRPMEFRLFMAIPFVGLFVVLAISLALLFCKARTNGLPLPSKHKIVQNILENYIPTAIATLIEPMWVLVNRLLCMLQPLEELQSCKAPANRSISLNYGSLPPQLVVFKALRSRHFVLALVCAMALLANLLAIALAGLFNQDSRQMWNATSFPPPFDAKFVSINGSIGPSSTYNNPNYIGSGAYYGGEGKEQFLIAQSNHTMGTPLPAWTDEKMLYLPFITSTASQDTGPIGVQYQARTKAFGAELDCTQLNFGTNYQAKINTTVISPITQDTSISFHVSVSSGSTVVQCFAASTYVQAGPLNGNSGGIMTTCSNSSVSAEYVTFLNAKANATQEETDVCTRSVAMGWIRNSDGSCGVFSNRDLDETNSLFIHCQPRIVTGSADVIVNEKGQLQEKAQNIRKDQHDQPDDLKEFFSNDPINIIRQSNWFLFSNGKTEWHNDTFPTDALNHFIIQDSNSSKLIDPNLGVPTFADVNGSLSATYSRLFAIWLGTNKEKLLVSSDGKDVASMLGNIVKTEQRLFLSTAMFAIAEGIICTYVIVAALVYLRRPGQYLAKLPTCIASIIALFAASAAVQDMASTSKLDKKEQERHLANLGSRYGYGSYIGADGRVHIGIEKAPFVRVRTTWTWFDKKVMSIRNGSGLK